MEKDSEEVPLEDQIDNLQETIAKLIVKNEITENQLTNLTFETNDVISYLKNLVEEKDEEIGRLENMIEIQEKEAEKKFKNHRSHFENEEEQLRKEIGKLKSEMSIMDTQLGNQHRIDLELIEMSNKLNELKKIVADQEEIIRRKEAEERSIKIAAVEQARSELSAEYQQAVAEIREEAILENKAFMLINNQIIEHLKFEIEGKNLEIGNLEQKLVEKDEQVEQIEIKKKEKEEENLKLRKLLEKSGQTTEKALKDSKRQLEESENKRKLNLEKSNQIENDLRIKLDETLEKFVKLESSVKILEDQLLKEKELRKNTIDSHKMQNKKIEELKRFLKEVLSSEEQLLEDVIKENRNAVFAHLALIISRIPPVQ